MVIFGSSRRGIVNSAPMPRSTANPVSTSTTERFRRAERIGFMASLLRLSVGRRVVADLLDSRAVAQPLLSRYDDLFAGGDARRDLERVAARDARRHSARVHARTVAIEHVDDRGAV